MFRINGMEFDGVVNHAAGSAGADIAVIIPNSAGLTDEQILELRFATELEELIVKYGTVVGVSGRYSLVGWRSVDRVQSGTKLTWQTYRITDLDQIKQDNEDLTEALLELAAIVGGGENG